MKASIYVNGRPILVDVDILEGVAEFIEATHADDGLVTLQVTLVTDDVAHHGNVPLTYHRRHSSIPPAWPNEPETEDDIL